MRKAHRPMGRFFLLMDGGAVLVVPASTLMAPPTDPAVTQLIEGLFGHKSGADKKNTALTLGQNSIQATDAVTGKPDGS